MKAAAEPMPSGPYERTILVLQGGGALGAYQAGVYASLQDSGFTPDWVAGISIGAINSALIAGNPPERRKERLRAFWERVSGHVQWTLPPLGDHMRAMYNQWSSLASLMIGQPGFFQPRLPPPFVYPPGAEEATSFYDTSLLRSTLLEFVDFDLLNEGPVRFSVGAVNVRTGNFTYFDNRRRRIGPEHVMASGALPPGFPAVEIDGEAYWDGGIVSNTPLQYVLDDEPRISSLVFQVDLFSAEGQMPRAIADVMEREKDIRFSSRTRYVTNTFKRLHRMRHAVQKLYEKLPPELRDDPEFADLGDLGCKSVYKIVHLIYRRKYYERESKDYEFSRNSMIDHWNAGEVDTVRTLRQVDFAQCPPDDEGVAVHDMLRDAID